jgi:hypothetical protein
MHAPIPPAPLDSESVAVLALGNARQRAAFECVMRAGFFDVLVQFRSVLVSTIALGIDTPKSDLDFLCQATDLDHFAQVIARYFHGLKDFRAVPTPDPRVSRCYSFWFDEFEVEIFGSTVSLEEQLGYLHYVVMAKLLNLGGAPFRDRLRAAKLSGMKSEPAIAELLKLSGDPYQSVAELVTESDERLKELLIKAL